MTSASGLLAMRNRLAIKTLLLPCLLAVTPLRAAAPADETEVAAPRDPRDHPEYQAMTLSEDALHPRKEISDEQAVAFPDDF